MIKYKIINLVLATFLVISIFVFFIHFSYAGNKIKCENFREQDYNCIDKETFDKNKDKYECIQPSQCTDGWCCNPKNEIPQKFCCRLKSPPGGGPGEGGGLGGGGTTGGIFPGWVFDWLLPGKKGIEYVGQVYNAEIPKKINNFLKAIPGKPAELVASAWSLVIGLTQSARLIAGAGKAVPEKPLAGNDKCHLCNWDNYTVCTKERCEILGSCYWQPVEDEREGLCLPKDCEAGRPDVTYLKAEFLIDRTNKWRDFENNNCPDSNHGCSINVQEEVPHNVDTVRIQLDTEEAGECYYIIDKQNANLSEMTKIPVEADTSFLKTRTFEIDLTGLELGQEHTIYFKCRSTCDIKHDAGFDWNYIKFKFEEKPDELPPVIVRVKPDDKRQYLSSEDKYALIEVWLDENGWCGYSDRGYYLNLTKNISKTQSCNQQNGLMCHIRDGIKKLPWPQADNDYFVLSGKCVKNQRCVYVNELGEISYLNKYDCTVCYINISLDEKFAEIVNWTQLRGFIEQCQQNPGMAGCDEINQRVQRYGLDPNQIQTGISKIFALNFRCVDERGNIMREEDTYEYRIMTYPPYNMTIIEPEQGMQTYEREIYMEVNTTRPTYCKYSVDVNEEYENMSYIEGTEVLETNHTGYTHALDKGQHTLYVKCRDIGGLQREGQVSFTIMPAPLPKIIRMWVDGTDLIIETDIKAECVYSVDENKKCNFNALEASNFSTLDNYLHLTPLVMDWTYYVKCRDVWHDNAWPTDCTAIINPFELPRF